MSHFANMSIQRKLVWIIMLTSSVSLLFVCVAFVVYDVQAFRRTTARDLGTIADIIGINAGAALVFNDAVGAEEILSALRVEEHVVEACIYNAADSVFATYRRDGGSGAFPPRRGQQARFEADHLVLHRPIRIDDEPVGSVYIQADLRALQQRLTRYAGIVVLVAIASTVVALLLSSRLQRVISDPIVNLAHVARRVSEHKDYSVRATKRGSDEIGLLIDGFNEMLEQIERRTEQLAAANRELESFSYSVSHDLRVPVRAVVGLCDVLTEEHTHQLDDEGRRIFKLVRRSALRMRELIDDLLEFSRLGRDALQRQRVRMNPLVAEVVADLRSTNRYEDAEIVIGDLDDVDADPNMLRHVWMNLISNGLKFSRAAQPSRVQIGCTRTDDGSVYFVRDNGVGFDMNYAHKLFTVFQRLHTLEEFEGTGVGLALVERIVRRHGGRIWATSTPGEGATFRFVLEENVETREA